MIKIDFSWSTNLEVKCCVGFICVKVNDVVVQMCVIAGTKDLIDLGHRDSVYTL